MSTKVFGAHSDELGSLSSLEYLVSPLHNASTDQEAELNDPANRVKGEFNNSLQKLTNLVYLLSRETTDEREKRTALILVQSEVAHLAVLARQAGITWQCRRSESEVTH